MLKHVDSAFAQTGWQQEAHVHALPSGGNHWVQADHEQKNIAVAHEAVGFHLGESRNGPRSSDTAAYNDETDFVTVGAA